MASARDTQDTVEAQQKILDRLEQAAHIVGSVISVSGDRILIATGSGPIIDALRPEFVVRPGNSVTLNTQSMQIVSVLSGPMPGRVVLIKKEPDGDFVEIEDQHDSRLIFRGSVDQKLLEPGTRVRLNSTGDVIVGVLGKPGDEYLQGETSVSWEDIGGLVSAKAEMIEAIEHPYLYPDLYKHYNRPAPKGILLSGPPGCGKTLLARAAATAIAQIYKGKSSERLGTGFMYVKGPEILSKWVGEAESEVRAIFSRARSHKKAHGFPAVIVIDEAESILSKRGTGVSSDMEKTIVPMFLAEMDGMEDSGAVIVLATNRPDRLDPAILRDGRVDRKLEIKRPDPEATAEIIQLNLAKVPLSRGLSSKSAAEHAVTELFDPKRLVLHREDRKTVEMKLHYLVSGAMAANLVNLSTSAAIRRDIASKAASKKQFSGVCIEDIQSAVDNIHNAAQHQNHADVIEERKANQAHAAAMAASQEAPKEVAIAS